MIVYYIVTCFRIMLFQIVIKLENIENDNIKGFRIMLFQIVIKLLNQ